MSVLIKRVGNSGITMVGKDDSGHWVPMDGPTQFGGHLSGVRPMELLAISLGGCTSMDVLSILQKMKVELDDYEMTIDYEKAPEHPKVFTKMHLKYTFYGTDIPEAKVEKAIKLSEERYCSASAMLRATVEITNSYEILPARGKE